MNKIMHLAEHGYGLQNRVPRFNSGRGLHKTPVKSLGLVAGGAPCVPLAPGAPVQKPGQALNARSL